jgi:hypothetical protein
MPQLSSSNSIVFILDSLTLSLTIVPAASCSCTLSRLLSVAHLFLPCIISHACLVGTVFQYRYYPVFQIVFQYYNTLVFLCFETAFLSTKKAENQCEMLLKGPFSLLDFGVTPMHRNT